MSGARKHDALFDDVLAGIDSESEHKSVRGGARFLKRSTSVGEALAGEREEKVLHWIDPAQCRMWERHNRDYALLNENNCADLIDGIRAQGQQEFPAVVRKLESEDYAYEVICGARRHFAVSWLRANNYPQFKYLVEVRDLTDEEAFRLADIENRDRNDISDYERAKDYAQAIELYYGGRQKKMASRLDVSEAWLSRYLQLAKLPQDIVAAFASIHDIRELHARTLKPLLSAPETRGTVLTKARQLAKAQAAARDGQGALLDGGKVVAGLRAAAKVSEVPKKSVTAVYEGLPSEPSVTERRERGKTILEVPDQMSRTSAEVAIGKFLDKHYGAK